MRPDLWRIAIVAKHGGVYFDSTFVLLKDLDWLIDIARWPTQYIYNRYGKLPRAVFSFHPWFGNSADWELDLRVHTKSQWHMGYENNFFAAEPDLPLMHEWFNETLKNVKRPWVETEKDMKKYKINGARWTQKNNHYLMPMESLKLVVARRQFDLQKAHHRYYVSASDYYRIWSFSGYLGPQKYRGEFNLVRPQHEEDIHRSLLMVRQFSQQYVEKLIGPTLHFYKFYGWDNQSLKNHLLADADKPNYGCHPHSLVANSLLYLRPVIDTKSEGVTFPRG